MNAKESKEALEKKKLEIEHKMEKAKADLEDK
jgi:hypothetical protein